MSFNLLESVKNIFNYEFLRKASSVTGESENNIKKAMSGIVPSLLAGIMQQAATGNPQSVLNWASRASQAGIPDKLTEVFDNPGLLSNGNEFFRSLFGERTGQVSSLIAYFSGIRESSAASLMQVTTPAALGVLGKHAAETRMGPTGLLGFLNNQKESILTALPSGLHLAGAMGLGSLAGIGEKISGKLSEMRRAVSGGAEKLVPSLPDTKIVNWLPLVLGTLLVLGIFLFMSKGCNPGTRESKSYPMALNGMRIGEL